MKKFFKRLFTDWLFTCKFFFLFGLGTLIFTICVGEFNALSFCSGVLIMYVMWLVDQIPLNKLPGWLRRFLSKFDASSKQIFQCVGCPLYDPDYGCIAEHEFDCPQSDVPPPWEDQVSDLLTNSVAPSQEVQE